VVVTLHAPLSRLHVKTLSSVTEDEGYQNCPVKARSNLREPEIELSPAGLLIATTRYSIIMTVIYIYLSIWLILILAGALTAFA